jgi:hypothetical protein
MEFMALPKVKELMHLGGVIGTPDIRCMEEANKVCEMEVAQPSPAGATGR